MHCSLMGGMSTSSTWPSWCRHDITLDLLWRSTESTLRTRNHGLAYQGSLSDGGASLNWSNGLWREWRLRLAVPPTPTTKLTISLPMLAINTTPDDAASHDSSLFASSLQ